MFLIIDPVLVRSHTRIWRYLIFILTSPYAARSANCRPSRCKRCPRSIHYLPAASSAISIAGLNLLEDWMCETEIEHGRFMGLRRNCSNHGFGFNLRVTETQGIIYDRIRQRLRNRSQCCCCIVPILDKIIRCARRVLKL